jgi:hypothetical protein
MPETTFVHGIFSHVGSISLELLRSIRLLSNARGMRRVFLHSLGQERSSDSLKCLPQTCRSRGAHRIVDAGNYRPMTAKAFSKQLTGP